MTVPGKCHRLRCRGLLAAQRAHLLHIRSHICARTWESCTAHDTREWPTMPGRCGRAGMLAQLSKRPWVLGGILVLMLVVLWRLGMPPPREAGPDRSPVRLASWLATACRDRLWHTQEAALRLLALAWGRDRSRQWGASVRRRLTPKLAPVAASQIKGGSGHHRVCCQLLLRGLVRPAQPVAPDWAADRGRQSSRGVHVCLRNSSRRHGEARDHQGAALQPH